jgi:hypothetical protein
MSKIPLQTCYVRFAIKYVGYDYEFPSDIFKNLLDMKRKKASFGSHLERLTLNRYEVINQEAEKIRNKRLVSSLDQFSLMMIEYPVSIFYSNGSSGEFSSKELFSLDESIDQLVESEFKSLNGKNLYIDEVGYTKSYNKFFHIDEILERNDFVEKIKMNSRSLCCFELFNKDAKGAFELLAQYQNEEVYQDDGEISDFLQKTYGISSTDANRYFLPILRNLKI